MTNSAIKKIWVWLPLLVTLVIVISLHFQIKRHIQSLEAEKQALTDQLQRYQSETSSIGIRQSDLDSSLSRLTEQRTTMAKDLFIDISSLLKNNALTMDSILTDFGSRTVAIYGGGPSADGVAAVMDSLRQKTYAASVQKDSTVTATGKFCVIVKLAEQK